jgi:hypothetical protein
MKRIYLAKLFINSLFWLGFHTGEAYAGLPVTKNRMDLFDQPGALWIGVNTLSFIKNDEYFGPIIQGHTLVGHHIHPYLSHHPTKYIQVKGGVFMRRDWADTHFFSKLYPTFSIQYQSQDFKLLLGNIETKPGHHLIRPLYNPERFLFRGSEPGLQVQYIGRYTWVELWLEWLSLLDKQTNKPEELGVGWCFDQVLLKNTRAKLSIPIQLFLYHLGGQGILVQSYSLLLGALGVKCNFLLSDYGWLQSLKFENYGVFSRYMKEVVRPFKQGQAFYSKVNLKTAWLDIGVSYWQGNGFISEDLGDPLYQSIAWINQKVASQEKNRQLLLLDFDYTYQLTTQMDISIHLAPYYDLKNHWLEHSAELYVTYHPLFELASKQQSGSKI